ncbi:Tubby-like F-box protein 5 [Gossypium arboreum]|uniref:Tubby-like F-box protein 5 n=1 Tax=Gossypium arboreum TaxID=29729 RepID=A0A0B0N2F5_GOSAR|nr:Tubby-like F-box protein 5 [Gossypium arboreum]
MSGTWYRPRHVSQCKIMFGTWHRQFALLYEAYQTSFSISNGFTVPPGDQGTWETLITLSPEQPHGWRHDRVSQPYGGHGLVHGRVPWLCALKGLLTSKIECQGLCTRAKTWPCHGCVRDTSHGYGRVASRVKTPIGRVSHTGLQHGHVKKAHGHVAFPNERVPLSA